MLKILRMIVAFMAIHGSSLAQNFDVYVGTYTGKNISSKGIYHAVLDVSAGTLSDLELAAESPAPTFLAFSKDGKTIYSVAEGNSGMLRAFEVMPDRKLRFINEVQSQGKVPCHVSISSDSKTLFVANYGSGNLAAIRIKPDYSLSGEHASVIQHEGKSVDPKRQTSPHVHSVNQSPDGKRIYAVDLGTDKIMVYDFDANNSMIHSAVAQAISLAPGAGPRHMAFSPDGKKAYVANELDSTVSVIAISYMPEIIQTVKAYPEEFKDKTYCAEIKIHPSGKFLYVSNRGHDSIAVFRINPENGTLHSPAFQTENIKFPRHFCIDPSGKFCIVANQNSDSIALFRINQETGFPEGTCRVITIGKPAFVGFLPNQGK